MDPDELVSDCGEPALEPENERTEIGSLIDGLPEAQRRVLALRYVYDFSIADIADVLDKSPDAIRHIQMRALRAVRTRPGRGPAR